MNILCFTDCLGSGGAQRQLVTLARGFHQRGHHVEFLTYYSYDFYRAALEQDKIAVHCLNEPRPLRRIWRTRRFLRKGNQDVVLAFLETPCLLAELAAIPRRSWGLVVSERSANCRAMQSVLGRASRQLHRLAEYVTTNANTTSKLIEEIVPSLRGKVCTIYNTVDQSRFFPSTDYVPRRDHTTRMLVAASYIPCKNAHGLLDAIGPLCPTERARFRIDWYGNGDANRSYYDGLASRIREECLGEVITLHPPTADIGEKIRAADVVGLFSYVEGLPNIICEGMCCGKPIVMSRVSDAEALVAEEQNGYLCDPGNPDSITVALRKTMEVSDESLVVMGKCSRRKADVLFDEETVFGLYLDLLEKATRNRCRLR